MEHIQSYQRPLALFAPTRWGAPTTRKPARRIVSRGQAGVDRAALDAALAVGLSVGGHSRTRDNVEDSDATLILTMGAADEGCRLAADIARRIGKPCLVMDLEAADAHERLRTWLAEVNPGVLNVAGPRSGKQSGMYGRAYAFLSRALRRVPIS